jgi:hypothetical protein
LNIGQLSLKEKRNSNKGGKFPQSACFPAIVGRYINRISPINTMRYEPIQPWHSY